MNNDITFEKNDLVFNYRVAIVIRKNDKILVQKDDRAKHLTLPGGRCEFGECSTDTAIREFKEETGLDILFKKAIGIIENFFTSSFTNKKMHEILMIHELEFTNKDIYNLDLIHNIEEKKDKKDHLTYIWISIEELKKQNFTPDIILNMIINDKFEYYISK